MKTVIFGMTTAAAALALTAGLAKAAPAKITQPPAQIQTQEIGFKKFGRSFRGGFRNRGFRRGFVGKKKFGGAVIKKPSFFGKKIFVPPLIIVK